MGVGAWFATSGVETLGLGRRSARLKACPDGSDLRLRMQITMTDAIYDNGWDCTQEKAALPGTHASAVLDGQKKEGVVNNQR